MPRPQAKSSLRSVEERNQLVLDNSELPRTVILASIQPSLFNVLKSYGFEDAVQVGNLAMMRAAELFNRPDPKQFRYYAYVIIKRAVIREILTKGLVCVPTHLIDNRHRPSSRQTKINRDRAFHVKRIFDKKNDDDAQILSIRGDARCRYTPPPSEKIVIRLNKALNCLPPDAIEVVCKLASGEYSYRDLASEYGVTHETVRTRYHAYLRILRVVYTALEEMEDDF